jgi:autotransporter-associated beta strand protein
MADTVEIKSGGATIDTAGWNISILKDMTGAGGLTKKGAGRMILAGGISHNGNTVVEEGFLEIYVPDGSTHSYGGAVQGAAGRLVKSGAGTLALEGSVSHNGETQILGGTLILSSSFTSGGADSSNTNAPTYVEGGILRVEAGADYRPWDLRVGWSSNTAAQFVQTGGASAVRETVIGLFGNGTNSISGGTFTAKGSTFVGMFGTGLLEISGGTYNAQGADGRGLGSFRIGDMDGPGGIGTMTLSGTGVVNASSYTAVGGLGNGTLNVSGGTWNNLTDDIVVGDRPPGVTDWTGTGVVNQSGGAVNARAVFLQAGTYNLDGGVLTVAAVGDTMLEANGVFNFNGGTLQASGNHEDFLMADTVEIQSGGATIDTVGNEVWVNKAMVGVGGLTKKGSGLLKLAGANTYSGSTTVQEGTLRIEKANFVADATPTTLTVNFVAAPADGLVAIFPGTLSGNPSVTFNGLAAGQTGQFSPLSGEATFTTAVGVSFSSWSGGQALTPALLGKYAIGGAAGPSAVSASPVLSNTGGLMTLSALVRTNASAGTFSVVGEYSTNLTGWSPLTNNPAGTPSANTNGVPEGFQRRDFSVPTGSPKMFLRLKSTL